MLCLVHGDFGGVHGHAAGAECVGINLLHDSGIGLLADGIHGNHRLLTHGQGENIGFVHSDGGGHGFVGIDGGGQSLLQQPRGLGGGGLGRGERAGQRGGIRGGGILVGINNGFHGAADGGEDAAVHIQLHQLLVQLLIIRPLLQQSVIVGGVGGILQGEQLGGTVDRRVFLGLNIGDGSGVAGDLQGGVDIEGSGVEVIHGDGVTVQRAVIGDEHNGFAGGQGIHGAGIGFLIRGHDGDLVTHLIIGALQVYGHISVQRDQSQSAVLVHHGGNIVLFLGVNPFDPAGYTGADGGADGILAGGDQLLIQRIQLRLHIGHNGEHGAGVDGGQHGALLHPVALLCVHGIDGDSGGELYIQNVFTGERAGAGDGGADGAGGDLGSLHLGVAAAAVFRADSLSCEQNRGQKNHQHNGCDSNDFLKGFLAPQGFVGSFGVPHVTFLPG